MQQIFEDEGSRFAVAAATWTKGRYMDVIFGGADYMKQAQNTIRKLNCLCLAGGIPFQEWIRFRDGSRLVLAAVMFKRSNVQEDKVQSTLVCPKTKVAPLKQLTIPWLKLLEAAHLTKLVRHTIQVLNADESQFTFGLILQSSTLRYKN